MNPYQKYQQQMVTTMTQGESLMMLYDETLKQMDVAKNAIVTGKTKEMDAALEKAEKIVRYLRSILDFRYPVSNSLSKLYDFFNTQMVMASVKKDAKPLDDIRPLVQELRDTFDQCDKINRVRRSAQVTGTVGNVV